MNCKKSAKSESLCSPFHKVVEIDGFAKCKNCTEITAKLLFTSVLLQVSTKMGLQADIVELTSNPC
jgi:hypothetical protein